MYQLLKNSEVKKTLVQQTPSFGSALLLSELVYKFGSFTLECIAFLVTWFVIDWMLHKVFYLGNKQISMDSK